jgi:hypothetical protein
VAWHKPEVAGHSALTAVAAAEDSPRMAAVQGHSSLLQEQL